MANSLMQIVSDGTLSTVPLTIRFFEQAHIKVYVNDVELPNGTYSYVWANATTVTISPSVALGQEVTILRRTPADAVFHDFQAGAVFNEKSMDENFQQELFLLQEASEQSFVTDLFSDLDMHGNSIKNLAPAVADTDAVTLAQARLLADGGEAIALRAELAAPDGTLLVGGMDRIRRARGGSYALLTSVSITDFLGKDDGVGNTGTNNKLPLAAAITYLNSVGGGTLRLPLTATGVYFINGDDPTPVSSTIRLDPDPGVSIRLIYSGGLGNSPLVDSSMQATRQLPIYLANFGFTFYIGSNVTRQLGETLPTANNGAGVYCNPTALSGSDFVVLDLSALNVPIAPVASSTDSVTFAGGGVPRAAVTRAAVGDEYMALLASSVGGVFFAGVTTVSGYVHLAQDSGSQDVVLTEATSGAADVTLGIPYSHTMNQQRDLFNNALLSVKVTSSRSFSVMVNGLVVHSYTARSSITGVMFGTTNVASNVSVSQMSAVRQGKTFGGAKPLRILMVGDSITDNAVQYSHAKYLPMVLGSAGISVAEVSNIAVGGQTAAQQYARLQTIGSGFDVACIQVGVNDVQGRTDFGAFVTTIANMVTYCKSIGTQPIVAIPTAFYSRAEANANGQVGGQDTANNEAMHTYRALLIRAVAAAGGLLNMETIKGFGGMTAKWLSIAPYSVSDRLVVDNIHPTPYGSMMLAQGWARSIIGWLNRPDTTRAEGFEAVPSYWISSGFGTTDIPYVRGRELRGTLSLHATLNNDGAVAMALPPMYQVPVVRIVPVSALGATGLPVGVCSMYLGANGLIYFFNLPVGTTRVQLDGVEV